MWWQCKAEVTLAADAHDLILDKPIKGNTWKLDLEPYTIRTFRISGVHATNAVSACAVEIDESARAEIERQLETIRKNVAENLEALKKTQGDVLARNLFERVDQYLRQGDLIAAYDAVTISPDIDKIDQRLWKEPDYTPRQVVAVKRKAKITIDAEASEWKDIPAATVNEKEQMHTYTSDRILHWKGPRDHSSEVRTQWDEENVYLFVQFVDDDLYFSQGGRPEKSDSVELYFDVDILGDYGDKAFTPDDSQYKFAPPLMPRDPLRMQRQQGIPLGGKIKKLHNEVETAWKKTENGFCVEIRIPWKLLGLKNPPAGTEIGFDMMSIDYGQNGRITQTGQWSAPRPRVWSDVRIMGRMMLK